MSNGISEGATNLSTDMAVSMSKKFLKSMAQPFEHSQLGVSLWDVKVIEEFNRKSLARKESGFDESQLLNTETTSRMILTESTSLRGKNDVGIGSIPFNAGGRNEEMEESEDEDVLRDVMAEMDAMEESSRGIQ